MPPGRKPLDPQTKREHRRLSSAAYEVKQVLLFPRSLQTLIRSQKLRAATHRETITNSDYHTRRKYRAQAADHSEQYRARILETKRVERRSGDTVKRRVRKLEADNLRISHKLAQKPVPTQGHKQSRERPLPVCSSQGVISVPMQRKHRTASEDGDNEDSDSDCSDVTDTRRRLPSPPPFFPARIGPRTAVGRPCKGCGLYDCPSCACMCEDSPDWVDHLGGHFFPDCKNCGGTDCPGCSLKKYVPFVSEHGRTPNLNACHCVMRDHSPHSLSIMTDKQVFAPAPLLLLCEPIYAPDPGHEDRNNHAGGFFAVVHEHWKEKTLARMLDAYPDSQTFDAPTWSRFQDLWNQDCTEYHYHPDTPVVMPVPASKLPSPGPPGSLPTEDARKREAAFKHNLLHKFALFKPPPVPMSEQHASALFTRVLGVNMLVDDIAKRMAEASLRDRAQPVEDINLMKEEMAPEYAVKNFPATFNSYAHAKLCLTGWPVSLPCDGESVEDSWARKARLRDYLDSLPMIRSNFGVPNVFEFEPQEHSCKDHSMHTGEFFAVVHEEWKGAVTSEKTLERMLYIYPGAHTFKALTWSDFLAKWNAHCTETHHHSGEPLVVPESQLPSTRGPGLLPTEEARSKEEVFVAEVKARMRADFAIYGKIMRPRYMTSRSTKD
ncbi:hypothetical protein K438DRAFT_1764197 [Mycena galopus ATCC 62051]|nr:hypothetical protein K438DRAFT_1764197 [Mycena galopus ATCC 62051]